MPQPIRNRAVRVPLAGAAAVVLAVVPLSVLSETAHAAGPTKHTTYKDSSVDADISGSIKLKFGASTGRVAKLTLIARCEDGKEKRVLRGIQFKSGDSFGVDIGPGESITGTFKSKHKVTGKFRTQLCGFFSGSYTAKD